MKNAAFAVVAALCLTGCSTTTSANLAAAMKEIASDPRCGHVDRITGNLGGLSANSLNVFLERTCPPQTQVPAAP